MLPAVFAVFGDWGHGAGSSWDAILRFKPNQIERRWPVGRRQVSRTYSRMPIYSGSIRHSEDCAFGFSVRRGILAAYIASVSMVVAFAYGADRPIWQERQRLRRRAGPSRSRPAPRRAPWIGMCPTRYGFSSQREGTTFGNGKALSYRFKAKVMLHSSGAGRPR